MKISSPANAAAAATDPARPFGAEFPNLDSFAIGEWWTKPKPKTPKAQPATC